MKIALLDGRSGKVVKVLPDRYKIKIADEQFWISIKDIKWTKTNKLFQTETDYTGKLCVLQSSGVANGTIVKIQKKESDGWRFHYSTGCGGVTHGCNLKPIEKGNGSIRMTAEGQCICDCCGATFEQEQMQLYFIRNSDGPKNGVVCNICNKFIHPFLVFNSSYNLELDVVLPTTPGSHPIRTFDVKNLKELNDRVRTKLETLSKDLDLVIIESHKQVRPTAMEYKVLVKLHSDVEPKLNSQGKTTKKGK
jgi:hypothetical protein